MGTLIALTFLLTLEPRCGLLSGTAARAKELRPEPATDAHQQRGRPYLRTLLVQGAQHILGPFGVDCDLRRWGLRLAERGGKNGKKRAIIATERKLAVSLDFSPLGNR